MWSDARLDQGQPVDGKSDVVTSCASTGSSHAEFRFREALHDISADECSQSGVDSSYAEYTF